MLVRSATKPSDASAAPADAAGLQRNTRRAEAGVFLLAVAAPLAVAPFAWERFTAAKLVLVLGGTWLLWSARLRMDRRILNAALAFIAAAAIGSLGGVDPLRSLLGQETQGIGFATLAASALLLAAGTGLDEALVRRGASWIVWAGCIVAAVALVGRTLPAVTNSFARGMVLGGSTLGHPLFLGGFCAFALVATLGRDWRRPALHAAVLGLLTSGLALSANRSAWLGTAAGLAIAAWRSPPLRRRIAGTAVIVIVVLSAWTAADAVAGRPGERLSAATRFGELGSGTAQDRTVVWRVNLRASSRRPILGWGPGNTWDAYLSSASPAQIRDAGRGWGDAHNLPLEILVTTGLLGLAAAAWLIGTAGRRAFAASGERAWAAGAAVALAIQHLLQPLNVVTTPLAFLALGIAAGARGSEQRQPRRIVRAGVMAMLASVTLLAGLRVLASGLERYAREYDSQPAARSALRLDPARLSAAEYLWLARALDSRSRRPEAFTESWRLAIAAEGRHPWDPMLRLAASDAALIADRPDVAAAWLESHLARFPNDPVAWVKRAVVALRSGDREAARRFARRALALAPGDAQAASILAGSQSHAWGATALSEPS